MEVASTFVLRRERLAARARPEVFYPSELQQSDIFGGAEMVGKPAKLFEPQGVVPRHIARRAHSCVALRTGHPRKRRIFSRDELERVTVAPRVRTVHLTHHRPLESKPALLLKDRVVDAGNDVDLRVGEQGVAVIAEH